MSEKISLDSSEIQYYPSPNKHHPDQVMAVTTRCFRRFLYYNYTK